ncbi:MAG TPA: ATP-binding protein, partial [Gemmatimonadales bacterium]|nr:ATP-binding protein [Gemmatimonadales bacterium]
WVGELDQRTRDGRTVTIEGRWTLVRDDAGRPTSILAINTDITRRRALEQQFIRAQRLESIGTLAGGIAHDLNNVLAPIIMSIDLLTATAGDPETLETLELIGASARRGAELVRQVLSFARGLDSRRSALDPGRAIHDVVRIVSDTFPRNIRVVERLGTPLRSVDADPTQLHQVILNLCVNARDAMPNGGTLTLAADTVELDAEAAAVVLDARPGAYIRFSVADTGTGIPKELLDRIFEPFFTTKEVGKGTGLGLSTSLAIVQGHGGFVRVDSAPGAGTRFEVYLPAHAEPASPELTLADAPIPRGRGERILVVDDEASLREITRRSLEAAGYRVSLAVDGADAVAAYARERGTIAAVITDMMMPVMDGAATIRALRAIDPAVPVMAVSGLASEQAFTPVQIPGEGPTRYLPKPYTTDELLRALDALLHRRA